MLFLSRFFSHPKPEADTRTPELDRALDASAEARDLLAQALLTVKLPTPAEADGRARKILDRLEAERLFVRSSSKDYEFKAERDEAERSHELHMEAIELLETLWFAPGPLPDDFAGREQRVFSALDAEIAAFEAEEVAAQ